MLPLSLRLTTFLCPRAWEYTRRSASSLWVKLRCFSDLASSHSKVLFTPNYSLLAAVGTDNTVHILWESSPSTVRQAQSPQNPLRILQCRHQILRVDPGPSVLLLGNALFPTSLWQEPLVIGTGCCKETDC